MKRKIEFGPRAVTVASLLTLLLNGVAAIASCGPPPPSGGCSPSPSTNQGSGSSSNSGSKGNCIETPFELHAQHPGAFNLKALVKSKSVDVPMAAPVVPTTALYQMAPLDQSASSEPCNYPMRGMLTGDPHKDVDVWQKYIDAIDDWLGCKKCPIEDGKWIPERARAAGERENARRLADAANAAANAPPVVPAPPGPAAPVAPPVAPPPFNHGYAMATGPDPYHPGRTMIVYSSGAVKTVAPDGSFQWCEPMSWYTGPDLGPTMPLKF